MKTIAAKELWMFKKESDRFPVKIVAGDDDNQHIFSILYPYRLDDYFTEDRDIELAWHRRIYSTEALGILARKTELERRQARLIRFIEADKASIKEHRKELARLRRLMK